MSARIAPKPEFQTLPHNRVYTALKNPRRSNRIAQEVMRLVDGYTADPAQLDDTHLLEEGHGSPIDDVARFMAYLRTKITDVNELESLEATFIRAVNQDVLRAQLHGARGPRRNRHAACGDK
jgi:hypothetical protein